MKRTLCAILSAVFLSMLAIPCAAADTAAPLLAAERTYTPFSDIPAGAWYADAVKLCYETGVFNGTSDTAFSPQAGLTNAQLEVLAARVKWRLEGNTGDLPAVPADTGAVSITLPDGLPVDSGTVALAIDTIAGGKGLVMRLATFGANPDGAQRLEVSVTLADGRTLTFRSDLTGRLEGLEPIALRNTLDTAKPDEPDEPDEPEEPDEPDNPDTPDPEPEPEPEPEPDPDPDPDPDVPVGNIEVEVGDWVEGYLYQINREMGAFVAVDNQYHGLIPVKELSADFHCGDHIRARVTQIRKDGKLILSPNRKAYREIPRDAKLIWNRLKENDGFLPYNDKTSPQIIAKEFKMSKAAFKRALGHLMKTQQIIQASDGIHERK